MSRIDKVNFLVRAIAGTALTGFLPVKKDAGGSIVVSGTADAWGVVCLPGTIAAGRPVGVLLQGEVVEFGGSAATAYYATAGGSIEDTAGGTKIGETIEGDRLIVNM